MILAIGVVGLVGFTSFMEYGHSLDDRRVIMDDISQTNGDITVTMTDVEIGFRYTKININVNNDGDRILLLDATRAVLVQNGNQFPIWDTREVYPGAIYGGATEWAMKFEPIETDDFMLRLVLTNDDGKIVPFEINVVQDRRGYLVAGT